VKIKILALLLALASVLTVFSGCSKNDMINRAADEDKQEESYVMPDTDWIGGKPVGEITLVAYQATVPENSKVTTHKVEFQLPDVLDTEYDQDAFKDYSLKYKLTDYQMLIATMDKKLASIYKDCSDYQYNQTGETIFQYGDNCWGIIKDLRVIATISETEVTVDNFKLVFFGIEEGNPGMNNVSQGE